jgi:hypothetical protein
MNADQSTIDEIDNLLDQYIAGEITNLQCLVRISREVGLNRQGRKES